jgi:hypothetical protein
MEMAIRTPDQILDDLAEALAPRIASQVKKLMEAPPVSGDYDAQTSAVYVKELGDKVILRGEKFFDVLVRDGEIDSKGLTKLLDAKRPSNIAFYLTTPLKRRASKLGLERPWTASQRDGRTVWIDRGVAETVLEAIRVERQKRGI